MPFYVPQSLGGQSLQDIFQQSEKSGEYFPRLDILSGQLGISPSQKLTAGQMLSDNLSPGSGEYKYAASKFSGAPVTSTPGGDDIVAQAQKLRDFTIKSNQPAIASLEASKQPLLDRYNAVLDQIKGKTQETTNLATRAITSGLGARGLLPQSPEGQQALFQGLEPINLQFGGLERQTAAEREGDIANITNAIGQLQTGNPGQALQVGQGLAGIAAQLQAAQLQAQTEIQNARLQAETQRKIALEPTYVPIPGYGVYDILNKQLLGGFSQSGLSPSGNQVAGIY